MLDKQGYEAYLTRKKSSEKLIEERLGLLDRFNNVIAQNGITAITDIGEAEIIELIRPWNVSGRRNFLHNIASFLNDYSMYIKKENTAQQPLADCIESYYKKGFEKYAKSEAEKRRVAILLAPAAYAVNPEHLRTLNNNRFVEAFKVLQQFVVRCYEDIERTPFEWGYPEYETTEGYYNRVMDMLFALGICGTYKDGIITVDASAFFASPLVKRHKKDGLPKGCLNYKKGAKDFLRVRQGHHEPGSGHFEHHNTKIGTKVSFIGESNFVKMFNERIIGGVVDFSQYHGAIFCPNCKARIATRYTTKMVDAFAEAAQFYPAKGFVDAERFDVCRHMIKIL